jgi:hypothetical protein
VFRHQQVAGYIRAWLGAKHDPVTDELFGLVVGLQARGYPRVVRGRNSKQFAQLTPQPRLPLPDTAVIAEGKRGPRPGQQVAVVLVWTEVAAVQSPLRAAPPFASKAATQESRARPEPESRPLKVAVEREGVSESKPTHDDERNTVAIADALVRKFLEQGKSCLPV